MQYVKTHTKYTEKNTNEYIHTVRWAQCVKTQSRELVKTV